jgi:hypothetical protein
MARGATVFQPVLLERWLHSGRDIADVRGVYVIHGQNDSVEEGDRKAHSLKIGSRGPGEAGERWQGKGWVAVEWQPQHGLYHVARLAR